MRVDEELDEATRNTEKWKNDTERWFGQCSPERCGFSFSGGERDHLFISDCAREFTDIAGISGLDSPSDGRGFAMLDYDRDGWLDVAVVNANSPPLQLYHNNLAAKSTTDVAAASPRFVAVRLRGGNHEAESSRQWSNRDGVGAALRATAAGRTHYRQQLFGEGFAAQNSATQVIGLGSDADRVVVSVRWPAGGEQTVEAPVGSLITFFENPAESSNSQGYVIQPYRIPATSQSRTGGQASRDQSPEAKKLAALLTGASQTDDKEPVPELRAYMAMATWCEACQRQQPRLRRLLELFPPEQFKLHGAPIDPDDTAPMLADYQQAKQTPYRVLAHVDPNDRPTIRELIRDLSRSEALPATVIVDRQGDVVYAAAGVPTVSDLRRLLSSR